MAINELNEVVKGAFEDIKGILLSIVEANDISKSDKDKYEKIAKKKIVEIEQRVINDMGGSSNLGKLKHIYDHTLRVISYLDKYNYTKVKKEIDEIYEEAKRHFSNEFHINKRVDDVKKDENKDYEALNTFLNISTKISFFNGLKKQEIVDLMKDIKILKYKYGDIIFREGDTSDNSIYYLISGRILVSKKCDSTQSKIRLAMIDKPSLFGEMMRLTGKPRNATIESVDNQTIVVAFKIYNFKDLTPVSKFYKNVIKELSDKINNMNDRFY